MTGFSKVIYQVCNSGRLLPVLALPAIPKNHCGGHILLTTRFASSGATYSFIPMPFIKKHEKGDTKSDDDRDLKMKYKDVIKTQVSKTILEESSYPTDGRWDTLCQETSVKDKLGSLKQIGQPTPETHPHLMKRMQLTPGITRKEYAERRRRLMSVLFNTHAGQTHTDHVVIVTSSSTKYMSTDIPYPFRQNSDFLYLTGFQEPDSVLVMETKPGSSLPDHNMLLFVRSKDPKRELWDGPSAGTSLAMDYFGADEAFPITALSSVLRDRYGNGTHHVWYNHMDEVHPKLHREIMNIFLQTEDITIKGLNVLGHNLQLLKLIKSSAEMALMKKAGTIGARALTRVMLATRPGLEESHLQTVLEYESRLRGAQRLSFPPVVAGGATANTLHYINNTQLLRDGDLVLIDGGCEFHGYASDITRTFPVNGKFSSVQRQLYEIVLRVQEECLEHCKVGVSLDFLHHIMLMTLGMELQEIGLIEKNITELDLKKSVAEYCPHHLGHYLGMDTHDTPLIHRGLPLQPGMVITVEPGLYIPKHAYHVEERFRGIGIRIEDDVLITNKGPHILSGDCPKQVDDIEYLMSKRT